MSAERVERRLAAILAADVAGYSRLMGLDEAGTLARLKALRRELIDPQVAEHKGRPVDVKEVGRELGVRYVLEGSVRKGGNRVRITAQLIDAETGAHLWADRFDGLIEDVFELQDRVASSLAGVIELALQAAEIRRSSERPRRDLTAYDLVSRGLPIFHSMSKTGFIEAANLFERAIERDPHYGIAVSLLALCHMNLVEGGWAEDPESTGARCLHLARQALETAGDDPGTLVASAHVLAYFGEEIDASLALIDHALRLNPSYERGWYLRGFNRLWAGDPDRAIEDLEMSMRLSPRDRFGVHVLGYGMALFLKRRFDEAATKLFQYMHQHPGYPPTYRFLASSYAHLGAWNKRGR